MSEMPSLIMVRGPEAALADREISAIRAEAKRADEDVEIITFSAIGYTPGRLSVATAPSLFEEPRLVLIDDVDKGGQQMVTEVLEYFSSPQVGVCLVLRHRGGNKNRKVIDAAKKAGARMVVCDQLKGDSAKVGLVLEEARRLGGALSRRSASQIVDAVGSELYEVLGAVRQIVADYGPQVADEDVSQFLSGLVEADAFEVADALASGQGPRALILYRQARAVGVKDVPLLGAIAMKFRDMALATTPSAPSGWRATSARKNLRHWNDRSLGNAILRIAETDIVLKGGRGSEAHAIEKCIIDISRLQATR